MARPSRRLLAVALTTATLLLGLGLPPAVAGPAGSLVSKVNSARASNGKSPVQVYWDLTDDARAHARKMADRREVFNDPGLGNSTSGWKSIAGIVGVGPSVGPLFDALMSSKARSTILGSYNYIGVGAVTDSDGILWVSMIFMKGDEGLVDDPPSGTTSTTTSSTTTSTKPPGTTNPPSPTSSTNPPSTKPPATTDPPNSDQEPPTTTFEPPTTTDGQAATSTTVASETVIAVAAAPTPTTTTTRAPAAVLGLADQAGIAGTAGIDGGPSAPVGIWVVIGIIVVAGAGLILLGQFNKVTAAGGITAARPSIAAVFDSCISCGLVFNHGKLTHCPKCTTPANLSAY